MPIRGYFVIPRLTLDILYLYTKFDDSRFSHSEDRIVGIETENWSCTQTMPLVGVVCHLEART